MLIALSQTYDSKTATSDERPTTMTTPRASGEPQVSGTSPRQIKRELTFGGASVSRWGYTGTSASAATGNVCPVG